MDFSQSVYHLWKQFRRFGRDGGAPDPMQAPEPGGGAPGAIGGHDRLQLKVTALLELLLLTDATLMGMVGYV